MTVSLNANDNTKLEAGENDTDMDIISKTTAKVRMLVSSDQTYKLTHSFTVEYVPIPKHDR